MHVAGFAPNSLGEHLTKASTLRETLTDELIRMVVGRHLKPSPICPRCGVSLNMQDVDKLYSGAAVICRDCGKKHRLSTGTVLENVHHDLRDIMIVAILHRCGKKPKEIQTETGLPEDTVKRYLDLRLGASRA